MNDLLNNFRIKTETYKVYLASVVGEGLLYSVIIIAIVGFAIVIVLLLLICLLIASIIFVFMSFSTINYDEYGIKYDHLTGKTVDEVKNSGLYFNFFTQTYLRYPKLPEPMVFSSNTDAFPSNLTYTSINDDHFRPRFSSRTREGVSVEFDVVLFYQLEESSLISFHYNFGVDFIDVFYDSVQSCMFRICGNFSSYELMTEKERFVSSLRSELSSVFRNELESTFIDVYVHHILLWSSFEESIEEKVIQQQTMETLEYVQESEVILKSKDVYQSEIDYEVARIEAEAEAVVLQQQTDTKTNLTLFEAEQHAQMFTSIKNTFHSGNEFIYTFYFYQSLWGEDNTCKFIYNLLDEQYIDLKYNE